MQVTETNSEGLKREYKVVISAADLDARVDAEVKKIQGQVKMPGFRPGKAPLSLLKKLHGKNLLGQVLEETINATSQEALEKNEIRPAMQPKIEVISFDEGKDLEYSIEVEVTPEFDLPDLSKLKLERWVVEATDEQVMEAVTNIASQQKNFKAAAKTYKAKTGDAVLMDFVGKMDGEAFDGGAAEGHQLELGSNSFIPGFEEKLVGVKAGDEKAVDVTFPADYHADNLAGKDVVFDVKIHEVQKPADVEIDDEMAKKFGLEDLNALKDIVRKQVEQESNGLARTKLKRALLDMLADEVSFDVPASMVELEFNQIWQQLKQDLHREALEENPEIKPEDIEEPGDDVKEEYQAIAVRRVRLGLLLSEIGVKNDVQVTQEEVTRQISTEAQRYPGQEKQVFEFYQKNPQAMAQVRAPLYEEKVVDFILELADVTDKNVTRDELVAAIEAEESEDAAEKAAKKKPAKKAAAKKPAAKKAAAPKKEPAKKAAEKKPAAKKAAPKKAKAEK
ncbi:trigger factor [Paremcibacter congregatus]|uniref:Trigger factor n=1 Tax=Paremcibacter congregatus TaxID=2043170 RepID=A0A2G4YSJ4_9PROT|nr:trigger factor [Paremcibacter congregatus]PHZ85309.1 trigger factor [Paremcibacter congregatus]QDE27759.1 trigger factor [Paremcibacter congregatus]